MIIVEVTVVVECVDGKMVVVYGATIAVHAGVMRIVPLTSHAKILVHTISTEICILTKILHYTLLEHIHKDPITYTVFLVTIVYSQITH